jgi:molybdenum cofactor synthesis domain-containing protein
MELEIAIIVCSDTRSSGAEEDTAGPALHARCEQRGWVVRARRVLPDEEGEIAAMIADLADAGADVVLTCGGTGFGPRDVTPEATIDACEREAPGVAEVIRARSMEITPTAMLSRGVAAIRGTTLVVNLPGSEKGALESFDFVADQFEHAVEMMHGKGH